MSTASVLFSRRAQHGAAGLRYRADIDGLRAVAVIPVVLYHYGVRPFSGGYVGVDVFFVISGFLITSLIHNEMLEHRFSIINFYERRIRRIFPALFAMLFVTTAAALVALFPDSLLRFGETLAPTAGFISNFEFVHRVGYFDVASIKKPLLHTWSLAVEEQFYLLFPGLLFLCRGASRRWLLAILGVIFVLSLALNIWGVRHSPVSTFFLLPFRFWELLMGAILAVGRFPAPENPIARNALSLLGIALIAFSVFAFNTATLFPGENAVIPCAGAALVIYAGSREGNAVSALLATRAFVGIGLISYSLYLWHWPVLVIANAYRLSLAPMPATETVCLIALSFALAYLSWRFVELPFRGREGILSRRGLFIVAGAAMIVTAVAGFAIRFGDGFPGRYDAHIQAILAKVDEQEPRAKQCWDLKPATQAAGRLCTIGKLGAPPDFLLWGDSHSDAMLPAIDTEAAAKGRAGLFAGGSDCAPLLGIVRVDARPCNAINAAAIKTALRPEIKEVFLVARWATYTDPKTYSPDDSVVYLGKDMTKPTTPDAMTAVLARGLANTVQTLTAAKKKVVIVASVPELKWVVPQTLARAEMEGVSVDMEPTLAEYLSRQKRAFGVLEAMKSQYGADIVYPQELLCTGGKCMVVQDGLPLYRDGDHLTASAARALAPLFAKVL